MQDTEFKPCPFCKETIRAKAVKCRYCGEWLEQPSAPQPVNPDGSQPAVAPAPIINASPVSPTVAPAGPVQSPEHIMADQSAGQEDLILGQNVYRELTEQLNIYPAREAWEREFLKQRKEPDEKLPQRCLDELWAASDQAGKFTEATDEDMEIGDSVFRQLTEKLKRYPLEEEWVEAFQTRKSSRRVFSPLTLRKIWLAADISGRKPRAERELEKNTGQDMSRLRSLNGILLTLYVIGIIGILMRGDAFSLKNIGSNLMVLLMALCPLSGFMAASKPDNKARRTFAKFANGTTAGFMLMSIVIWTWSVVVAMSEKNRHLSGWTFFGIFFLSVLVGLPAFANFKAFRKEKPSPSTTTDESKVAPPNPDESRMDLPPVEGSPLPLAESQLESTDSALAKRANYFVRHWRGDLSLGVSYWMNGFLANFLILFAASMMTEARWQISLEVIAMLTLTLYALVIVASVWQCVGVWRSAGRHESRGGSGGWAIAAKVAVVFGILSCINLFLNTYIPQSAEMFRILTGDTSIPAYKIQILPGGTEVEFRGGMRAGSARELEKILAAVPQAKVLHIESVGGRVAEAEAMMKLVRDRNLVTYTSEKCMSAATLVLISGKERVIAEGAKVGFHAGTLPGMTKEQLQAMDDDLRSTMLSAGISESFISRVLSTPADQMWYPTYEEMKDAGVITSRTAGERFASSLGMPDVDWQAAIENLSTMPGYRVIKQVEPETFAFMMTNFVAALQSGKSEAEAMGPIQDGAARLMAKYLPAASDDAILAMRDQWIAILQKYKDAKSQWCIAFFMQANINYKRVFPDWNMTNSLLVMEKVISSGAQGIPVPIDKRAAEEDMAAVLKPVTEKYGDDVNLLYNITNWPANSQKVCDMLLLLYQQEAALPDSRSANLLRNNLVSVDTGPAAFLGISIGMSPQEARRALGHEGARLVAYEEYRKLQGTYEATGFDLILPSDAADQGHSQLYMPPVLVFGVSTEAQFVFREDQLDEMEAVFHSETDSNALVLVEALKSQLANAYQFAEIQDSPFKKGAYALIYSNLQTQASLWVDLTVPKMPVVNLCLKGLRDIPNGKTN